jgi:hypothetical protein
MHMKNAYKAGNMEIGTKMMIWTEPGLRAAYVSPVSGESGLA